MFHFNHLPRRKFNETQFDTFCLTTSALIWGFIPLYCSHAVCSWSGIRLSLFRILWLSSFYFTFPYNGRTKEISNQPRKSSTGHTQNGVPRKIPKLLLLRVVSGGTVTPIVQLVWKVFIDQRGEKVQMGFMIGPNGRLTCSFASRQPCR